MTNLKNFIQKSKNSQFKIEKMSEQKIKYFLSMFVEYILDDNITKKLSKLAVLETGFGNVKDKITKKNNKTKGLFNDLNKVNFDDQFIKYQEISKPVGLIIGITPSTNPVTTCINYFMNSFRCKNSIIIIPNLRTYKTINKLIKLIKLFLRNNNLPPYLINLPTENLIRSDELITLFDLSNKIIITGGGQYLSSAVSKTKTPILSFGKGNPPIIIDKKISIPNAIKNIIISKSFDFSTSCSSDSVIIADINIYQNVIKELIKQNCYILNEDEKTHLSKIYLKKGVINPSLVAKNPNIILKKIGVKKIKNYKLIIFTADFKDNKKYLFNEKISPILTLLKSKNIEDSVEIAEKILDMSGIGHSAGIYSNSRKNINYAAKKLKVSRLIVNQPNSQSAGGNKDNKLPFSLSLGTGSWGGDLSNDNLTYKDFINTTTIVYSKKIT